MFVVCDHHICILSSSSVSLICSLVLGRLQGDGVWYSLSPRLTGEFFIDHYPENLTGFRNVKLIKVWGPLRLHIQRWGFCLFVFVLTLKLFHTTSPETCQLQFKCSYQYWLEWQAFASGFLLQVRCDFCYLHFSPVFRKVICPFTPQFSDEFKKSC